MSWSFFEASSKLLDLFLWCLQAWEQKGNWKVFGYNCFFYPRPWPADLLLSCGSVLNLTPVLSPLQLLFHPFSTLTSHVTTPMRWIFVSRQGDGACLSKSLLAPQPASTLFWPWQQNGSRYYVGSQMLYYVPVDLWGLVLRGLANASDLLIEGSSTSFSLSLWAVLGTQVWGDKVNCFWAGCILANVTFKIWCHIWWLTWIILLLWFCSNWIIISLFLQSAYDFTCFSWTYERGTWMMD